LKEIDSKERKRKKEGRKYIRKFNLSSSNFMRFWDIVFERAFSPGSERLHPLENELFKFLRN